MFNRFEHGKRVITLHCSFAPELIEVQIFEVAHSSCKHNEIVPISFWSFPFVPYCLLLYGEV